MVDEKMGLTFSVRNNPGVYALLVGSGISREADVPTGWEIIKDLTKKVAAAEGEEPESDPMEWYENEYGEEPQYDDLLEQLAPSKDDRQSLLESYFEPTDEERERGIKIPSESHESIAWLMKQGYVKIVVTTNFDRLLEQALREQGVTPTVISSPSEAEGTAPLAHQDAVILKINGDYKASNLKNTADELDSYDPAIEGLVKQVFNEYGLVVCGWSGTWDSALRELILSSPNRRYSMYWASYSELSEAAEELVEHRDGTVIPIDGAGEFFFDLKERVHALENAAPGAPLTKEVARERTKRYLTREEHQIDLADLIRKETERLRNRITNESQFAANISVDDDETIDRLNRYDKAVETLLPVVSTCAYWGPEVPNPADEDIYKSVKRIAESNPITGPPFMDRWRDLWGYPTMLLIYSIGLSITESENWDLIGNLLFDIHKNPLIGETEPLILSIHPFSVGRHMSNGTTYMKDRMKDNLRSPLRSIISGENDYEESFYEFGFLMDMLLADTSEKVYNTAFQPARSIDRRLHNNSEIQARILSKGADWGPLQAGLLDGSEDRMNELADYVCNDQYRG